MRSRIYNLWQYIRLKQMAGVFFVDLNACMLGVRHADGVPMWKGYRLMTNGPYMLGMGVICNKLHRHGQLVGQATTKSAA